MKNKLEQLMIWGFGNHEPVDMYRRAGKCTTGGIPGNPLWLEKWHNFFDSDESAALLEHLGVNIIHCRFYKGMGWEHEKLDFSAVRSFALRCRKRGIKVLAYVQHASLYWELMSREIPDLRDWAIVDEHGDPRFYVGTQYWRWLPCPSNPKYSEYMCGILQKAMDADCFDGVMFDNVFSYPCYCERCQNAFRKFVKQHYDFKFLDPDFIRIPPVTDWFCELRDPLMQAELAFRQELLTGLFAGFRKYIKERRPGFILSGNLSLVPQQRLYLGIDDIELVRQFDLIVSQSGNEVKLENGCVVTQVPELKFARAMETLSLPLNDNDGASPDRAREFLIARLCEALFGGGIVAARAAMRPKRGGEPDLELINEHKMYLDILWKIHRDYRNLLELPHFEPIGVLYFKDAMVKSQESTRNLLRILESLMRNQLPYRIVPADGRGVWQENLKDCTILIVPGTKLLSDKVIADLKAFKGRLLTAGDECGDYDENYMQRPANPFPETEKIPLTPHEILCTGYKIRIRWMVDQWRSFFPELPALKLNPESTVDFKCTPEGEIAGVLITSPVKSSGGNIELPAGEWTAEVFGGEKRPVVFKDGKAVIPAFGGACILERKFPVRKTAEKLEKTV